ncbi:cytochrome P450 [Zopfia rhizophila CBS 207.26]|uniref:Cytochrome P450 n=1 Tax=Zopfia rhizophila CBS 207.26 TaxID=1314779 RepID=A0A6A6DN98_9PEZI|nr:cytochrome P450 [Zopfia rhizophila CBS 207.26]
MDTSNDLKLVIPPHMLDDPKSHPALSFKASIDNDALFYKCSSDDLAPFTEYAPTLMMVGKISARVFFDKGAAQDEEWIDLATGYVTAVFEYVQSLKPWPRFLRPFVYKFLPNYNQVLRHRARAQTIIASIITKKEGNRGEFLNMPGSLLDHLTGPLKKGKEVIGVLDKYNGCLSKEALNELPKLDSWLKERKTLYSPDLMRGRKNKHQYMSVARQDLGWGFGRHACPGRFLADVEIKIAIAEILSRFEIQLPPKATRPKNLEFETNVWEIAPAITQGLIIMVSGATGS